MEEAKAEKDNILQQMAACDFSAPVDVTITFEDSNEEIRLPEEIKEEPITLVNSDNFRPETQSLTFEKNNENDDTQDEKLGDNSKENYRMILEDTDKLKTKSKSNYLKRKLESPPKTASNQINQDNIVTNDIHNLVGSERTTMYTTTNNDNNIRIGNENNKKLKEGDINNTYVPNLLNTVSKHISLIMEAFYHFTRLNNNTCDQNLVREAMNHYNQLKSHLFSLSYCTVADIILPQLNNPKFIQNFIYNTTTIANEKNPCSYQNIASLFADMVDWTKGKQKYLNILPVHLGAQHNSDQNNVILKQQLLKPPLLPRLPPPYPNTVASKSVPTPLHFNRNSQSHQFHSYTAPAKPYPHPIDLNRNTQNSHFYTVPSKPNLIPINENVQTHQPQQPLSHTTSAKPYLPPINRNAESNQAKSYIVPYENINEKIKKSLAESVSCERYPSDLNGNTLQFEQCIFSAGPSGRNINISVNPSLVNHQRGMSTDNSTKAVNDYRPGFSRENHIRQHEKSYVPQYSSSSTLPPVTIYSNNFVNINNSLVQEQPDPVPYNYQNRVPVPTENYLPLPVYTEKVQNGPRSPQNRHEPTRSTSTDSGFMSPLNFGTTEPTNNTSEVQQAQINPLITHVTSLNPKVSYNNKAACHVCGNITKHMCLGCFKIYYCSTECQRQDWKMHMVYCKTHEAGRKN